MIIHIPSPLRSYTKQQRRLEVEGETVNGVLTSIDRLYRGFRFRIIDEQDNIRPHIKIFVNQNQISDLNSRTRSSDTLHIICALSGGVFRYQIQVAYESITLEYDKLFHS